MVAEALVYETVGELVAEGHFGHAFPFPVGRSNV
jgi:hypothetical protein